MPLAQCPTPGLFPGVVGLKSSDTASALPTKKSGDCTTFLVTWALFLLASPPAPPTLGIGALTSSGQCLASTLVVLLLIIISNIEKLITKPITTTNFAFKAMYAMYS
ncbi:hypothetical protein Scep_020348 [Stephania cephalantha]|uniref:Uncharacterized protein n=1 Tax=Stephania cephalantha TaxID=152367 RepID=A0AAP0ICG4_9MAGN